MDGDVSTLHRLVAWNRFWLGLLTSAALIWCFRWGINHETSPTALRVDWGSRGVAMSTWSDGPFVVTHLVLSGGEVKHEGDKAIAELSPPIVIIDSNGAQIPTADVTKLRWRNIFGQLITAPPVGSPIRALYYRPLRTAPAGR